MLVSVREHLESDESFVIQGRRSEFEGTPMWTKENHPSRYSRLAAPRPCSSMPTAAIRGRSFSLPFAKSSGKIDLEIVKRSDIAKGFAVLPKRWIVKRTTAWLNRCRRLAKDWECLNRKALAFLRLAAIRLMLRKLCQKRA